MLKFISLGSGSSGNCYVLTDGWNGIIIDAGLSYRRVNTYFSAYGLSWQEIRAILLTHDHADHAKHISKISSSLHLPVFATSKIYDGIMQNPTIKFNIQHSLIHTIEKNTAFTISDFSVTALHTPHDSKDCVAYKIVYGDLVFAIITDCGHITEDLSHLISEADYLVIESNHDINMLLYGNYPPMLKERILSDIGHLSNVACADAISTYRSDRLKHVWLCHLSEDNNTPQVALQTAVSVVQDNSLQVDVLRRREPTGPFELA